MCSPTTNKNESIAKCIYKKQRTDGFIHFACTCLVKWHVSLNAAAGKSEVRSKWIAVHPACCCRTCCLPPGTVVTPKSQRKSSKFFRLEHVGYNNVWLLLESEKVLCQLSAFRMRSLQLECYLERKRWTKSKWQGFGTMHNSCQVYNMSFFMAILLMEEMLQQLGCIKPCKQWDKLPINWCRISAINSSILQFVLTLTTLPSHHLGVAGSWPSLETATFK